MRSETLFDLVDTDLDSVRGKGTARRIPIPGLSREDIEQLKLQGNPVAALAAETTNKAYTRLHRYRNVVSNSILSSLHSCPRRFVLEKIKAHSMQELELEETPNIDFVFGHAVGAGVQCYLAFERNRDYGLFAMFVAWRFNFDLGKEDYNTRKKKTLETAVIAVEKFHHWWEGNFDEWEIYRLPDGRPAVELSFCVDFGKAKYFGHIDLILRNRRTGRIAIGENKTTGYTNPNPALYQNSSQAIGYALILDLVVGELADYDVLYYAYSAPSEEWHHFPFAKTAAMKLEWIQDRLIDIGHMQQYYQLQHFPKQGASCFQFNRQCQFFGTCDLVDTEKLAALPAIGDVQEEYPVDYYFDVQELVERQARKAGELE